MERDAQSGKARRHSGMRRLLVWGGTLVVLVGIVWLVARASKNAPTPVAPGVLSAQVSATDMSQGPDDAPIVLVEYGDFQCPACGAFEPLLKQALAEPELVGKVKLVYRYFPLTTIHRNAQVSAQAAAAAALQGKFWQMHDKLYATQQQWESMSDTGARNLFATFAADLGLDVTQWKKDIDSTVVKDRIKVDVDSADASGVDATPTFYVNGVQMASPTSYQDFEQKVAAPLHATTTP